MGNDPLNATDPTGMCKNDSSCSGDFSEQTKDSSPNQSGSGLQDFFNFGDGQAAYVVDPQKFNLDAAIDIGSVIQNAMSNPNSASAQAYDAALANGGEATFEANGVGFNLNRAWMNPGNSSARNIGRFVGDVTGTIKVASDGSYTVTGSISFSDNDFSWKPDSSGVTNMAILFVGSGTRVVSPGMIKASGLSINNYPGTPVVIHSGLVQVVRGVGTPVKMDFNRTYNFTAWGKR